MYNTNQYIKQNNRQNRHNSKIKSSYTNKKARQMPRFCYTLFSFDYTFETTPVVATLYSASSPVFPLRVYFT